MSGIFFEEFNYHRWRPWCLIIWGSGIFLAIGMIYCIGISLPFQVQPIKMEGSDLSLPSLLFILILGSPAYMQFCPGLRQYFRSQLVEIRLLIENWGNTGISCVYTCLNSAELHQSVFMVSCGGVTAYLVLTILQSSCINLGNPKLCVCIHFVSLILYLSNYSTNTYLSCSQFSGTHQRLSFSST